MSQETKFNVNNNIKAKVTDWGYQVMANNHNKVAKWGRNIKKRDPEFYKSRADKNGYTQFQLWVFIEEFGNDFGMGQKNVCATEIILIL